MIFVIIHKFIPDIIFTKEKGINLRNITATQIGRAHV